MSFCNNTHSSGGLTHAQRNRLIKSTRKLGMVLGETPTVDSDSLGLGFGFGFGLGGSDPSSAPRLSTSSSESYGHGHGHGNQPSLSLARQSSGSSSGSTTNSRPSLSLPPPPITVHPPTSSVPLPMNTNSGGDGMSTPLTPTFVILNRDSPFCPTGTTVEDSDLYETETETPTETQTQTQMTDIRRKKMAKLVRTFGENVPPELVTIGQLGAGLVVDATGGIGSWKSDETKKYGADMKRSSSSTTISDSSSQYSVSVSVATTPPPPASPRSASAFALGRSKSLYTRSKSSSLPHAHQRATSGTSGDRELAFSRLTSGGAGADTSVSPPFLLPVPDRTKHQVHLVVSETHRKGREWSGEWNQRDMQQVVDQLRRLK
ncbi:hypothetical protein E1B28_012153 [Marasmius oreades]|uniref:Uncharacterized protein n=1 Tax=Marasmius oreades TaxID=181124 RepID=A0A9P7UQH2_9AGAR|nr:uncharacterized protein E1B28_012153 [Marasmius oreades]KAG7088129.1 hypothetical protein E1B28_012153 [Marasmius oreades]